MERNNIKGFYLHSLNNPENKAELAAYGVQKKITAQCKALNSSFYCEEIVLKQIDNSKVIRKFVSRLPFTAISEKWPVLQKYSDANFIYFRKNIIDYSVFKFFKPFLERCFSSVEIQENIMEKISELNSEISHMDSIFRFDD